jgi:hypothetical protein
MNRKSFFALVFASLIALCLPGLAFALIGDFDISGVVDDPDMQVISDAYGSHSWNPISPNWDWRADFDNNDKVDLTDLVIAGRNYGDTFNFHWPRRVSNGRNGNPDLTRSVDIDTDVDSRGNVHIIWQEYSTSVDWIYYTQLDSAGNTVVEDIRIDTLSRDARIAVDNDGNVHIVWFATYDPPNAKSGVLYTKLDDEGRILVPEKVVCDRCQHPAVGTDSYGHPHILARDLSMRLFYMILDDEGNFLLDKTRLNTQFSITTGGIFPEIDVDADDTRHILWYEDTPGVAGDLIYTRIPVGDIPSPNQLYVTHINSWNSHRLMIRVDSQGAAHILWHDYRGTSDTLGSIFWKRINPDGTMTAEKMVTNEGYHETPLEVRFSIDEDDRIHYVSRNTKIDVGYGMLDRDGNVLVPYQTIFYEDSSKPNVVAMPGGEAMAVFGDYNGQNGTNPVIVMSTVVDPAANDMSRPDLVLDYGHAEVQPWIARVIDSATITVTVTNDGWADANNVIVSFDETISHTAILPENIANLPLYGSATVVRTFDIPFLEDVTVLPIRVIASTSDNETTLTNNAITLTVGVIPPAHSVDLSVATFDETYAPDDRNLAAYLRGGQLTLEVPALGYQDVVTSTRAINGFGNVPLDPAGGATMDTLIRLTLTGPGYTTSTQDVTAARLAGDPYRVLVTPASPVPIYVNQWGIIQGTVYTGTTTTTPLANVTVNLDDGRTKTTDASGQFEFSQVISGSHSIVTWHAGNTPVSTKVNVTTGETIMPVIKMPPTTRGYVHGVVTDDLGRPFSGVTVKFKGDGVQIDSYNTDDQGYFSFEVADTATYANYTLESTCGLCDPFTSAPFGLTAGIPEIYDFTLSWSVTAANLRTDDEVTSWEQLERFNKLDEDNMSTWELIKYKAKGMVNKFKSYQVQVWWAKYHYSLGLNYSEAGGIKTVEGLSIDLANYNLYSYDVQVGRYHGGVEDIDLTALRVDRVDLVLIDPSNNVIGDPLWSDSTQWYAADPEGLPTWNVYNINKSPDEWSQAAVRIFIRVGKYTSDPDTSHWETWSPPVAAASLTGSGSGAGSDFQCLIWRLSSNEVEVLKSMAYYADVVGGSANTQAVVLPQDIVTPQGVVVSLEFPTSLPARVGRPFPVDVFISGANDQPVYALEFDLTFLPEYLRVDRVEGASDFLGPFGYWAVVPSIMDANTTGELVDVAVVRLGASGGISDGRLARIYFVPVAVTDETTVQLSNLLLADSSGETYNADQVDGGAETEIEPAMIFIPFVSR